MRSLALALLLAASGGCAEAEREVDLPPPLLELDASGAGGITAETPFSPEALREALPEGFALERGEILTESDTIPVLYAFAEGEIVLEVYPDRSRQRVGRIDASSARVEGPGGVQPGVSWAEADGDDMECRPGRGELTGRAVCTSASAGPVRFVFAHGARTARGELPARSVLRRSILERVLWDRR